MKWHITVHRSTRFPSPRLTEKSRHTQVLFEGLAERLPGLTQAGPARRLRSNFINGIKDLPVTLT